MCGICGYINYQSISNDGHATLDRILTYDKAGSPFYLSSGQMNLFDTSGIGALLGGVAGIEVRSNFLVGAYGGLQSTPYVDRLDPKYLNAGAFLPVTGSKGKSFSLRYNHLTYDGSVERQYAYANVFYPVKRVLVLYGDAEYELGGNVGGGDRLSRLFGNVRVNLGRWADLTASYSSGKGLDFHRYLIEASQDPVLNDQDIERFYYTGYYGARLSVKPTTGLRLSVARQRSEQKDAMVAPGISEALVATAMGLVAAIPAGIFFNRYADQVGRLEVRYDTFMEELSAIFQRNAARHAAPARGTGPVADELEEAAP